MDLRDRLRAMGVRPRVAGGSAVSPSQPESAPAPEIDVALPPPVSRTRMTIDQALSGSWHETPEGPCFYLEHRYPVALARGPVALGALLSDRRSTLWEAGRAPMLRDMDARRLLFLDTETTGLSGGTGTYVFLVGVAFYSDSGDEVIVRQYFMTDFPAERALLCALNDLFSNFSAVVTFNGKSFDWPLLETRYTYSRLRCVLRDPPHLDMLGPSRRLWKDRLPSCSLETLETYVLGVRRGFDVPGWRIPSLYFQYLHAGHAGHVVPVFDHNEHDLLTLIALTGHVGRILDQPDEVDLEAAEWFGLGKLYEDLGRYTESLKAYERGLDILNAECGIRNAESDAAGEFAFGTPHSALRALALRRLSFLYKYLQQRDEAVAIWDRLAAEGTHLMFPYLELAKHYEHRLKDYADAERYTLLALQRAMNIVERSELEHRLARIRSKAERKAAASKQSDPA